MARGRLGRLPLLRAAGGVSPLNDLAGTLIDALLGRVFEGLSEHDRLSTFERLFSSLTPEAQERVLLALARDIRSSRPADGPGRSGMADRGAGAPGARAGRRPAAAPRRASRPESPLQAFGPWRRCCAAMLTVSGAPGQPGRTAAPVRIFGALAHPARLRIIQLLAEGERSVEEVVSLLGLAQSTVSHHLKALAEAGLVGVEQRGRHAYYRVAPPD